MLAEIAIDIGIKMCYNEFKEGNVKFVVDPKAFLESLKLVGLVVHPRSPLPMGSCVKLSAKGNTLLEYLGVSGSMSICYTFRDLMIEEEGEVVVDLEMLLADLSSLRQDSMQAEVKGNNLVITSGKAIRKRRLMPLEEFPQEPRKKGKKVKVEGNVLSEGLEDVAFAMIKEGSRPELRVVRILPDSFIAGDGQRVVYVGKELGQDISIAGDVLDVVKTVSVGHEVVSITLGSWTFFETDECRLGVSRFNNQFPEAAATVVQTYSNKSPAVAFVVEKAPFLRSLSSLVVYADRARKFGIEYAELLFSDHFRVRADIPDIGLFEDDVPFKKMEGDMDFSVLFSPRLLHEDISQIEGDTFELSFFSSTEPMLIRDPGRENWILIQTVMTKRAKAANESKESFSESEDGDDDF